jgi:hypothetical protein
MSFDSMAAPMRRQGETGEAPLCNAVSCRFESSGQFGQALRAVLELPGAGGLKDYVDVFDVGKFGFVAQWIGGGICR